MKLRKKKGFTIIELVIVIAVIGILTAVLVPTFINLTAKANKAADDSLIKNLNTALKMEEQLVGNKKNETLQDAIDDLKEEGYLLENLVSKTGYDLLWDQEINEFLLNEKPELKDGKYWQIVDKLPENQRFSYYAGKNFKETSVSDLEYGFDAGEYSHIENIEYQPTSNVAKTTRIRTNSEDTTLTIDAPLDVVKHYGEAKALNIIAVAGSSYHENGNVKFMEISKGRIVLENESNVSHIHVNAKVNEQGQKQDEFDSVTIAKAPAKEMPELSRDDVNINANGTLVVALQSGTEATDSKDYVWLTKQGIYEQIKVSDSATDAGSTWVNTSSKSEQTKEAAQQIANNFISDTVRPTWNPSDTERDIANITNTIEVATAVAEEEAGDVWDTMTEEEKAAAVAEQTAVVVDPTKAVEKVADKEDVEKGATLFAGGIGTKKDPFLVYDYESFMHIGDFCTRPDGEWIYEPHYFEVCLEKTDNGVIDCYGQVAAVNLCGNFNGNGVLFKNVNSQLFSYVLGEEGPLTGTVEIKNFSVEFGDQNNSGVVYANDAKTLKLENINCSGYQEGGNTGSFIDYAGFDWGGTTTGFSVYIDNCHSSMTLIGTQGSVGGFIGHCGGCDDTYITNSSFTGQVSGSGKYYAAIGQGRIYIDGNESTWNNPSGFVVKTITSETGVNPSKYSVFTCAKADGCVRATASLTVGPNGNGKERIGSYFCEIVMSEELDASGSTISTSSIKYFDITSNGNTTTQTGISSDGRTFNLVNKLNGTHVDGASVKLVQYDALGNILKITTWNITPQN